MVSVFLSARSSHQTTTLPLTSVVISGKEVSSVGSEISFGTENTSPPSYEMVTKIPCASDHTNIMVPVPVKATYLGPPPFGLGSGMMSFGAENVTPRSIDRRRKNPSIAYCPSSTQKK